MSAAAKTDDELVDGLTPDEAAEYAEMLACLNGGDGLEAFIEEIAPEHAPVPRHLKPLIEAIQRAKHTPNTRILLSMPPGHAKTLTILRAFVWWLRWSPRDTCAYMSYSNQQAWSKSKDTRDLAYEAGIPLNTAKASAGEWRTDAGGGLLAAGVDGKITGQRVTGLAVIDDPFKSMVDAGSAATREAVWSFYVSVLRTRLERGASVIVVHTRWHNDDLIGRLMEREPGKWEVINLPALAEENDSLGRAPGEALWPEMKTAEELAEDKAVDEYVFSAMYQGAPRSRGTKVFGPETYYDPDLTNLSGCRLICYADPAASKKTSADHSAMLALMMRGRGAQTEGFVIDCQRQQVTVPEYVRRLRTFQLRHGNPKCGVEAVAGFLAVPQMLREIDPSLRLEEDQPLGDKFTRAQPAATAWNAGRLRVPMPKDGKPVPWLKDFLAELGNFTGVGDEVDDQVDCLSGAWNMGYQAAPLRPPARLPNTPRRQ